MTNFPLILVLLAKIAKKTLQTAKKHLVLRVQLVLTYQVASTVNVLSI